MKEIAALLPIKAHSERVKGKNFRLLMGKPLYCWILDTLLKCQRISQVIVDTDSKELINELNQKYPLVKTLLRPAHICGDMVSMNNIIAHDIDVINEYSYFLQTHTTNPLLSVNSIESAIKAFFLNAEKHDSLFSVNRIQARTYWADGSPINHVMGELKRTQDLSPVFEENSNLFIFSRESFSKTQSRIGCTPYLFETPRMESFEIDEEEDFQLIETILRGKLLQ